MISSERAAQALDVPGAKLSLVPPVGAAEAIAAVDWRHHPLGPREAWPETLASMVRLILASPQAMSVSWGPEQSLLFNDAYAAIVDIQLSAIGIRHADVMAEHFLVDAEKFRSLLAGELACLENIELERSDSGEQTLGRLNLSFNRILSESGSLLGLLGTVEDVSGQHEAHRRCAEAERQVGLTSRLMDVAMDSQVVLGVWHADAHTENLALSPGLARAIGLEASCEPVQVTREVFLGLVHPDDQARMNADIAGSVANKGDFRSEYRLCLADGGVQHVMATGAIILDDEGAISETSGLLIDIGQQRLTESELRATLEQRTVLAQELEHRIKNILAMVSAIAYQTLRAPATLEDAASSFVKRITALGQAQSLLTRASWTRADMGELIASVLAPYHEGNETSRFHIVGPALQLSSSRALGLALAVHELCTNAVKYGALSGDTGQVEINWSVDLTQEPNRFAFTWTERDGPDVVPPTHRGFGSRLVQRVLAADFRGTVDLSFKPSGVICALNAPLDHVDVSLADASEDTED